MGFTTKDLQLLCNKTENTPLCYAPAFLRHNNSVLARVVQVLYFQKDTKPFGMYLPINLIHGGLYMPNITVMIIVQGKKCQCSQTF